MRIACSRRPAVVRLLTLSGRIASRWVASARNTCAVVRASPVASCGLCAGRPSAPASSPSDGLGVAAAASLVQPDRAEHARVDHRAVQAQAQAPQRRAQKAALDLGDVYDRDAPGHRLQQRVDRELERRCAGEVGGAQAVQADRGFAQRALRAHEPGDGVPQAHARLVDRDRGEGDDLVVARVEPARARDRRRSRRRPARGSRPAEAARRRTRRRPRRMAARRALIARRGRARRRGFSEPRPPRGTPPSDGCA